jgi:O-glycosyl hydrolase
MREFFKRVGRFTQGVKGYGGGKEIPTVLTMNGESANITSINDAALDDAESRAAIDLIGRHNYGLSSVTSPYAKAMNMGYEVWMTEHNINSSTETLFVNDSTWNYVWKFMNDIDTTIRKNNESAFIWWALKRFYSCIGDGDGATTDGDILPRGHALSHYAKFASEMYRTKVDASGTTNANAVLTSSNFNVATHNYDGLTPAATAFVSEDGNTISLVMYTPTNVSGTSGVSMGTIKIQLPYGFVASGAVAMRSTADAQSVWETVNLTADRNTAYVSLPASNILSVKFTR